MPLLKLWNSLFGRSSQTPLADVEQLARPAKAKAEPATAEGTISRKSVKRGGRTAKASRLSLFGGGAPHGALRKLVKPLHVRTVLEISVGDGSRAIAILDSLGEAMKVRYLAIDQFEMAGGEVTLKAFHKTMRSEGIRPQVFPEPINRGLVSVANTVGPVNLIIIAASQAQWQNPETHSLLARVSHSNTVILFQDEEFWERFEQTTPSQIRGAA